MTQEEIENELKSFREQEQARRKNWRPIRISASICALVFLMGAAGLLAFSLAYPGARQEMVTAAIMLVMLSLPMSLLAAALRDPDPQAEENLRRRLADHKRGAASPQA